jgi:hypothetical protein
VVLMSAHLADDSEVLVFTTLALQTYQAGYGTHWRLAPVVPLE